MHLQVDKIDALETQHGWREEDFDFVLQFLRTVLMKRRNPLSLLNARNCCRGNLISHRWILSDIHIRLRPKFVAYTYPFKSWYPVTFEEADSEAQHH